MESKQNLIKICRSSYLNLPEICCCVEIFSGYHLISKMESIVSEEKTSVDCGTFYKQEK